MIGDGPPTLSTDSVWELWNRISGDFGQGKIRQYTLKYCSARRLGWGQRLVSLRPEGKNPVIYLGKKQLRYFGRGKKGRRNRGKKILLD